MANEVEIIVKATDQASRQLDNIEKTLRGTRTTIGGLDKEFKAFGRDLGTVSDAFNALGLNIPVNPMELFGLAVSAGINYVQDAAAATLDYANQVRDLSTAIGATPEEASKLIQAADDTRISYETLTRALQAGIRQGLEPTTEGLGDLADKYNSIQDPIQRTKFLLDNFGRSGAEMARLLELGSDGIKELGDEIEGTARLMDQEALDAAEDYRLALDALGDAQEDLSMTIGRKTIPKLTSLLNLMNEMAKIGGEDWFSNGQQAAERFVTSFFNIENVARTKAGLPQLNEELEKTEQVLEDTADAAEEVERSVSTAGHMILRMRQATQDAHGAGRNWADDLYDQADAAGAVAEAWDGILIKMSEVSDQRLAQEAFEKLDEAIEAGTISEEEYKRMTKEVGIELGGLSERQAEWSIKLYELDKATQDGALSTQGFVEKVLNLGTAFDLLPEEINVKVLIDVITNNAQALADIKGGGIYGGGGSSPKPATNTGRSTGTPGGYREPGFASGGSFVVPPGYPNDSFLMRVTSGEHVSVTPAGKGGGGGVYIENLNIIGAGNPEATGHAVVARLRKAQARSGMADYGGR